MTKKRLLIYGTSVIAELAHEYFTHDSPFNVAAFTVEGAYLQGKEFLGLPVFPFENIQETCPPDDFEVFIAVGSVQLNYVREKFCRQAKELGYSLAGYVSSRAQVWPNVTHGENCLILPQSVIQPFVRLGHGVFVWDGSNIGHHSIVEDYAFIASAGISGLCSIGRHSFLGAGALVGDGVSIAEDSYIALGAVVHKSTKANGIYRGDPAKCHELDARTFCGVKGV
jgi:sugar O-acyltransferase (sialic acid O-acetyltransferase NeuD family)